MSYDPDLAVVVGIDIGGTGTRLIAIDDTRTVHARTTVPTPATFAGSGSDAVTFLTILIKEIADGFRLTGVGIGASGPIDENGVIQNADTVPGFTGVDLLTGLESALDVPVVIDNDAVCAAIAECAIGAGRGYNSLLVVTLGTGIGTCLVIDGRAVRGGDGQHPEGGHISIPGTTALCYCGRTSCWEQSASRGSLQARAAKAFAMDKADAAVMARLTEEAHAREPVAGNILAWYGNRVGEGLSTLLAVHRPQAVVFAGSAGLLFPHFEASLRTNLQQYSGWISSPALAATTLDDHGGAIGASLLAQKL